MHSSSYAVKANGEAGVSPKRWYPSSRTLCESCSLRRHPGSPYQLSMVCGGYNEARLTVSPVHDAWCVILMMSCSVAGEVS